MQVRKSDYTSQTWILQGYGLLRRIREDSKATKKGEDRVVWDWLWLKESPNLCLKDERKKNGEGRKEGAKLQYDGGPLSVGSVVKAKP